MKCSKTQSERLLDIHKRLKRNEYPNCKSLAELWEVSPKTIQRDIEFLKYRLDAPIGYDFLQRGYYYTEETFMLPAFPLSEGELIAMLMSVTMLREYRGTPLAEKLESVCGKLSEFLPDTISVKPEELFSRFSVLAPPSRPIPENIWASVLRGLLDQRMLEIVYTRNEDRTYRVAPLHLANLQGDWYLFVRFEGHVNFRQLALSRIKSAEILQEAIVDALSFNPSEIINTSFGSFAGDHEPFTVLLEFDSAVAETVTERQWHPTQKETHLDNGNILLGFPAKGFENLLHWIQAWGAHCEVIEPIALRNMVREEAASLLNRYEDKRKK